MTNIYSPDIDSATSGSILSGWVAQNSYGTWAVGAFNPPSAHTKSFGQATPTNHAVAINTGIAAQMDGEIFLNQVWPAVGSGVTSIGAGLRYDAAGQNGYLALAVPGATSINIRIYKLVAGTLTELSGATYTPPTADYVAGFELSMRFQVSGNSLKVRCWSAAQTEPSTWQYSTTDTNVVTAGYPSLYVSTSGTLPVGVTDMTVNDVPTGATATVAVTAPASASSVAATLVTGTYTGYAPDGMLYAFDGGTPATAMTDFSVPSIGTWQGYIAGVAAGSHTLTVAYAQSTAVTATSDSFTSSATTVVVLAPNGTADSASYTLSGTYSGAAPSSLDYSYDGSGTWTTGTGLSLYDGTWQITATAPAAGSHTVQVRYTEYPTIISAASASFSTGTAPTPSITVNTPITAAVGDTITISGTYSSTAPTGLNYSFDGGTTYTAASSPTIASNAYSFAVTAPAAGSHTVTVQETNSPATTATSGSFTTVATTTIAPTNANILYSPGNWSVTSAAAVSINAGAYLEIFASGSYFALNFDVSLMVATVSEIEYQVDGYEGQAPWKTAAVASKIVIPMPSDTSAFTYHLIRVRIKSTTLSLNRWNVTGVASTAVKLTGIAVASTSALVAYVPRRKQILEFGDSITEGVRTVNYTATNDTDQNSSSMSYGYDMRNLLGAEVGVIGFGSQGWSKTGTGNVPGVESTYNLIYAGVSRSFSGIDMVLINQGTNNSATAAATVTTAVTTMLNGLLAAVDSGCAIVVMRPFNGTAAAAIQAGIAACSAPNRITYLDTTGFFVSSLGADNLNLHPSGPNHLSQVGPKVASALLPLLYTGGGRPIPWSNMLAA